MITIAIRGSIVLQVVLLAFGHGVWLYAWHSLGYKPVYGAPESWSSPPLSQHPSLVWPQLLFLPAVIVGPLAILWTVYRACRPERTRAEIIWAALAAMAAAALWLDPFGALNWYLD